jgi:hypothetical protein
MGIACNLVPEDAGFWNLMHVFSSRFDLSAATRAVICRPHLPPLEDFDASSGCVWIGTELAYL